MLVYGLDPGPTQSGLVVWDDESRKVVEHGHRDNHSLLFDFEVWRDSILLHSSTLVIEGIQHMGMPVGKPTFETAFWSGRFFQAWPGPRTRIYRGQVKQFWLGKQNARGSQIKEAILKNFGGKETAVGTKVNQGPLYGLRVHEFSALAVALTFSEQPGLFGAET